MEEATYQAVRLLKSAAMTIEKNAEKMIGGYSNQTGNVIITITINPDEIPKIAVNQEMFPDEIADLYR